MSTQVCMKCVCVCGSQMQDDLRPSVCARV